MKTVGVLALQGAFIEHVKILKKLGVATREVRLPHDLEGLSGLIIPGGESTTIHKLAVMYGLIEPLRTFSQHHALWGTCAGMILMAKEVADETPSLNIMDIAVERNAFGRQVDSFEAALSVPLLEDGQSRPFPAIFIRAPKLRQARGRADVIARLPDGTAVAAVEGRMLATAFHPELSADNRFHRFFLGLTS